MAIIRDLPSISSKTFPWLEFPVSSMSINFVDWMKRCIAALLWFQRKYMKISAIKIIPFIFMVAKTKSKHETKLNEIILLVWQGPRSQSLLGARMNSRAKKQLSGRYKRNIQLWQDCCCGYHYRLGYRIGLSIEELNEMSKTQASSWLWLL